MDSKLKWCKDNAAPAMKNLSDEEILIYMSAAYDRYIKESDNSILIYHGTPKRNFKPDSKFKNPENDYGCGLYTTEDMLLAKEWAMSKYNKFDEGYVFGYKINLSDLNVLHLDAMDSLYWLAALLENRPVDNLSEVSKDRLKRLVSKYHLDLDQYDVIRGYRADDSYFTYAKDFLRGDLYREQFDKAITLGNLGLQYCIKSEKAFNLLVNVSFDEASKVDRYRFNQRDLKARNDYVRVKRSMSSVKETLESILLKEGL